MRQDSTVNQERPYTPTVRRELVTRGEGYESGESLGVYHETATTPDVEKRPHKGLGKETGGFALLYVAGEKKRKANPQDLHPRNHQATRISANGARVARWPIGVHRGRDIHMIQQVWRRNQHARRSMLDTLSPSGPRIRRSDLKRRERGDTPQASKR